jgi:hypothetical protein
MAVDHAKVRSIWGRLRTIDEVTYFFDHLASGVWVEPLVDLGAFENPPARTEVSIPSWPASRYLARIAPSDPGAALRGFDAVAEVNNPRVWTDLLEVLSSSPPDAAASRVKRVLPWIAAGDRDAFDLPLKSAGLMSHLAEGDECDAALRILRALLFVNAEDSHAELEASPEAPGSRPRARARIGEWEYSEVLRNHAPRVFSGCGLEAAALVARALNRALSIEFGSDAKDDYSRIWRPSIAEHDQNWNHGEVKEELLVALRDGLISLLNEDRTLARAIAKALDDYANWSVFKRLRLHVLTTYADAVPDLVDSALSDPAIVGNVTMLPELKRLAEVALPLAAERTRNAYADAALALEPLPDGVDPDLWTAAMDLAQFRRLAGLRDYIPAEAQQRLDELSRRYQGQVDPDFTATHASFVGPTSPISAEELQQLGPTDVVQYLREWRPDRGFGAPSEEGLGRVLATVVQDRPSEYSSAAEQFRGVDPTYVRAVFSGLRASVNQGSITWQPVLRLGSWVVAQPRDQLSPERYDEKDNDWSQARKELMRLLEDAMGKSSSALPPAASTQVWDLIEPITSDPDPTQETEAQYGHPNMDPLTYSINTVRGQALHATAAYVLWSQQGDRRLASTEGALRTLDAHLRPEEDPSPSMHSVYGWWLSALLRSNRSWVAERLGLIFPADSVLFDAALTSYLPRSGASHDEIDLLRPVYRRALSDLATTGEDMRIIGWKSKSEALVDRVVWLYLAGSIEADDELITRIWSEAPSPARADALEEAGRILHSEETLPPKAIQRLVDLWTSRSSHGPLAAEEAAAFHWWFSSRQVDPTWSFPILHQVLPLTSDRRFLFLAFRRLAEVAPEFPADALAALREIAQSNSTFELVTHRDETRTILESAVRSGDAQIRRDALDLADRLGRLGLTELKNLLDASSG